MAIRSIAWLLGTVALVCGCRSAGVVRDAEFGQVADVLYESRHAPIQPAATVSPVAHELAGPNPVEVYVRYALAQNAGVQASRKRIDAAAMRVTQAAGLSDPVVDVMGWPFFPYVQQTAAGRMTVEAMVSQDVPWFGKLATRAAAAEEDVNITRAQLAAIELKTIEQVKRSYYELFYAQQAIRVMQQDQSVLASLVDVANAMYTTGKSSQQDVLRLQAELSSVDGELIRLEQSRTVAQADLAQLLHVSPETPLSAIDQLPHEQVPRDLDILYRRAVASRPELHALFAELERDRLMVEMAHLEYFPDATVRFGWGEMTTNRAVSPVADGIDNLTAGLSFNLPLYRRRLHAAVRGAEATAVASAREYDQLKDETQRDVKQLFSQANSQHQLDSLFRASIIPRSQQALDVAIRGYQVGQSSFADLIANWRELLRYRLNQLQLEVQLRQTLAALERAVGGLPIATADAAPVPVEETPITWSPGTQ